MVSIKLWHVPLLNGKGEHFQNHSKECAWVWFGHLLLTIWFNVKIPHLPVKLNGSTAAYRKIGKLRSIVLLMYNFCSCRFTLLRIHVY